MGTDRGLAPESSTAEAAHPERGRRHRLLVEGWRFIHHSYAIVAQAHCLSLLRRGDIELRFRDLPFPASGWQPSRGILDSEDERALAGLQEPGAAFAPEATLRFARDFSPPPAGRVFVFDTPEFGVLRPEVTQALGAIGAAAERVHMLVPSHCVANAYLRHGIAPGRVHVVPHGVDPRVMHPDAARRVQARQALGLHDSFVFMSVGAMTGNKAIDLLLRAFAQVVSTDPESRLVLKGADDLYASRARVQYMLDALARAEREAVAPRIVYLGDRRSARDMADLLRAADVYVAPYLAEGFNLPVLEAAACGVPVICTAGGATDDFVEPSFGWRIRSRPGRVRTDLGFVGEVMEPDVSHLLELMQQAVRDPEACRRMGTAGAEHVAREFTWDRVTERLVGEIFA